MKDLTNLNAFSYCCTCIHLKLKYGKKIPNIEGTNTLVYCLIDRIHVTHLSLSKCKLLNRRAKFKSY